MEAKSKKTRKKRDKESKKEHDFSKPILFDLQKIGTEDDCFGVLHDLSEPECNKCGDCELCAIVFAQRAHVKRAKQESTFTAKDLEEEQLTGTHPKIREYLKAEISKSKKVRLKTVTGEIESKWLKGKTPEYIKEVIKNFNIFILYKLDKKMYIRLKKKL